MSNVIEIMARAGYDLPKPSNPPSFETCQSIVRAALRAALGAGYKLVPIGPTSAIASAVSQEFSKEDRLLYMGIWLRGHHAMLSAAPDPLEDKP